MNDRSKLINGRYKVGNQIEKHINTFAVTRNGTDIRTGEHVEITLYKGTNKANCEGRRKLSEHFKNHLKLTHHNSNIQNVFTNDGIPHVYYYGDYTNSHSEVLVSERVGENLQKYFESKQYTLKMETIADIAVKLINICQTVHNKYLLIRYISPEVFSLDKRNELTKLYLTDFHTCESFIDQRSHKHIAMRHGLSPYGLSRYASISVGLGKEYGRRDDLEAIGYIFVYFAKHGTLPWIGIERKGTEKQLFERISRVKLFTPIELLCEGLDKSFADFIRSVRSLEFEEQPDYQHLSHGFASLAGRRRQHLNYINKKSA